MADWIAKLCDREKQEDAKRNHVAGINNRIAESLKSELENCVSAYNEKHPQQFVGTISVSAEVTTPSDQFLFAVKKNTKPAGEIAITFHFQEAKLSAKGKGLPSGGVEYAIEPEIRDHHFVTTGNPVEAVYFVRGDRRHRVPELVQELLSPLMFPRFCAFPE
jgi:hypothetical protein